MLTIFFLLSACVAVVLAPVFLFLAIDADDDLKSVYEKHLIYRSLLLIGSLVLFFYSFFAFRGIRRADDLSDFLYKTLYEAVPYKIDSKDILKEKDKPTKYILSINGESVTISEDVYNQYIGDDSNAVSINKATVTIYEGSVYPFGIKTKFTTKHRRLKLIYEEKTSYPWETPVSPYSEEEIRNLTLSYIKGDLPYNGRYDPLTESRVKELKTIPVE